MSKSYLLINEPPLTVSPTLAKIIGLDEAIVIQQVHYWLMNSKNAGRTEEGEKWVYNTYEEWQEGNFPFWNVDKIQRLFLKLEKQGLIISRQFDAKNRDMRKFYRIAYDDICMLHDSFLRPSIDAKLRDVKMNQRIPENTNTLKTDELQGKYMTIENAIALDIPVTQEMADTASLKDTAPKMFEAALGFKKPLPWWSNKEWTAFAEWVCEEYQKSKTAFGEYNIWRFTPYVKGGIANTRLRGYPAEFYDSWDMFMMSRKDVKSTDNWQDRSHAL